MIVDIHTHIPECQDPVPPESVKLNTGWRPDRPVKTPVAWHEYMEAMEPVDRAIVFGIAIAPMPDTEAGSIGPQTEAGYLHATNDATAEFVAAHPDKLVGFLSVHPLDPHCLEEMERAVRDLGLRGLKLGPNYQGFDPLSEEAWRVYARAQDLRLPILFHTGTSPVRDAVLDYAHPRHFDRIAIAFPHLKMVLAHLGHPWQTTTIAVIRKHPNLFADVSALFYRPWSFYNCMRLAEEWSVLHKLLMGSDFPVSTPQENIDALRQLNKIIEGSQLPRISEAAMEELIHRDALRLLGLDEQGR